MALTNGTKLGFYEIVAPLGAGGTGEVYRAKDVRLGRDVAIKALPDAFGQDPERLARFDREARLLASLNHPNVAGIHGVEEVEGHRYLVLEFVAGETLAARLARGALPVDEALEVCRQVASGVEAAHEAGVVHRDLKPGNVMLGSDGSVKVLDFGLAKSGSPDRSGSDTSLSASPPMTAAATSAGVILGTAAYMSPEQARGRAVDKRSDIWSFGCVLFESLTACRAFQGETVSDTIAAILKTEADLGALPGGTPARVRELLARCLCKDPRERLRDIGEARVLLGSIRAGGEAESAAAAAPTPGRGLPSWLVAGGALALAALAVVVALLLVQRPAPGPLRKLDLVADGVSVGLFTRPQLSPDGAKIAYIAKGQLWVRDLDQLDPHPVANVEGSSPMCWSLDSRELAFDDRKKLWKVAASGGTPVSLCDIPGTGKTIGLAWSARGIVALSVWRGGIYTVPAAGGSPSLLIDIDPRQVVDFHDPSWLANGDLMYAVHWAGLGDSAHSQHLGLEVFADGRRIPIAMSGEVADPTVTGSGKLLYGRRDANAGIWALGYDERQRRTTGEPRLVAAGATSVSASNDGSLLYVKRDDTPPAIELVWVDRSGKVLGPTGPAYPGLTGAELSPDRRHVAFATLQAGKDVVWVRNLVRGIDTRITFSNTDDINPHWLGPNSLSYVEFDSTDYMHGSILAANADGSGGGRVLAPATGSGMQGAFIAPDGKIALRVIDERGHDRLRLSPVLPDGSLGPPSPFAHFTPEPDVSDMGVGASGVALAPSGRLVAYTTSDEQPQVFLTRFPSGEGQWQVSMEGGRRPRWMATSGALYYLAGSGPTQRWLVEVTIDSSQDPPVRRSTRLFEFDASESRTPARISYNVGADGQRFLVSREVPGTSSGTAHMVLVQNWESGLSKPEGQ